MTPTSLALGVVAAVMAVGGTLGTILVLQTSGPTATDNESESSATPPPVQPFEVVEVSTLDDAKLPDGIRPQSIALAPDGSLIVADYYGRRVYRRDRGGNFSLLAGSGEPVAVDGVGAAAGFAGPAGVAVDSAGNVYVADDLAHRVRKIDPQGRVTTLAGGGEFGLGAGSFKDAAGGDARFNLPVAVAVEPSGSLIVVDKDNHRIRRVAPDGRVTTVAGTGATGLVDGPTNSAALSAPSAAYVAADGTLFVTEHGNNAVRRISTDGTVSTVVATAPGALAPPGSGPASGTLSFPTGLVALRDGSLIVADTQAHRLVRILPDGNIEAFAGDGTIGDRDGVGNQARFTTPMAVIAASADSLLIGDLGTGKVKVVDFR